MDPAANAAVGGGDHVLTAEGCRQPDDAVHDEDRHRPVILTGATSPPDGRR
jgi:hypothetical protein